jgi:Putative zinc- or iron-chelating domain
MSTAIKESQEERRRLIQIERNPGNGTGVEQPEVKLPSPMLESLREEVAGGFLYAHSRANANSNKLLEVSSFSYALIELLSERGLITIGELDERKEQVHKRLAEKFAEKGMGVALTKEEKETGGRSLNVEIDCENRLHLCQAACCRLRFALTVRDVEKGNVKWNLGQPYMIRQGSDGYCHHLDRESRHCGIYEDRPFVCRAYDCRKDQRIWQDFEKRVVSPELEHLVARLKTNSNDEVSGE